MAKNRCKYYKQKKQVSYDNGVTWQDVVPAEYQKGELYEQESADCGYVPPTPTGNKLVATYTGGTTYEVGCNESSTLTSGETRGGVYSYSAMTSAVIGDCVRAIGDMAFESFMPTNILTSVTIPNSVTTIGDMAFMWCGKLKRVNSSVDGVCNIPNGVVTIGDAAFRVCSGLTSVTIPNSVTTIKREAFEFCDGLKRVNSSVDGVCNIPNGVVTIYGDAFMGFSGLTSLNIPDSVTSINRGWALSTNTRRIAPYTITSVTVDSRNTVYDSRNNCNGIIETSTNSMVFGCKTTIIPNTVTSISASAFSNADGLTSIGPVGSGASLEIPNSVTSIGLSAFERCGDLTSIIIPNSVTTIGEMTFESCESLTSVTIPNSVTTIGNYAFDNCNSLTSVTIPNSVTTIGGIAFHSCSSLTSVTIPNSVAEIGNYAFQHCTSLTSVTVNRTTPPTLGAGAVSGTFVFDDTNKCPIYVPAASVNTYKTATNWSTYASRIQAIP